MDAPGQDTQRQTRLNKLFSDSLRDSSKLETTRASLLFIEAVCAQEDVLTCVERLVTSQDGLACLQKCIRCDLSNTFLNGSAAQLLRFLSDPVVASIDGGMVLKKIVEALVQPGFFWSATLTALKRGKLEPPAIRTTAWLLSELLRLLPGDSVTPFLEQGRDPEVIDVILSADEFETRALGNKIKNLGLILSTDGPVDTSDDGPGGRHDNDFQHIQDINVFPTRDELLSTLPPFLRIADEVFKCDDSSQREQTVLDNQFRLLREDMIKDLREEIRAVLVHSKNRHRGIGIAGVRAARLKRSDIFDPTVKPWNWQPWSMRFQSQIPLPGLASRSIRSREKFLMDWSGPGSKILRAKSLMAIISGHAVVGFGFIDRNVRLLALDEPEIAVQLDDTSVLLTLQEVALGRSLNLLQVDTPIFAYEPFLRHLQTMREYPMAKQLLQWTEETKIPIAVETPMSIVQQLLDHTEGNLKHLLNIPTDINLDKSQRESLVKGLIQRVSAIQGPPGEFNGNYQHNSLNESW